MIQSKRSTSILGTCNIRTRALITWKQPTKCPREILAESNKISHIMDHYASRLSTRATQYEKHETILIVSSLTTVNKDGVGIQLLNLTDTPYTILIDYYLADCAVLTLQHLKHENSTSNGKNCILEYASENSVKYFNQS